jgi:hypothetical protein
LPRSGIELLANAQYVGANNQQNLGPNVNVSFGISHRLGPGQITLFENNAFNTYAGIFATDANALPLALSGGGFYETAATPLTPRTIFASYAVALGGPAPGPSFRQFQHGSRVAVAPTPVPSPSANPRTFQRRFTSNPPPPGTDPLSMATTRDTCDATAQTTAKPLYDGLHAYVAAYEQGQRTPNVPDLTIVAHKTAQGATVPYYLEVRPHLPRAPGEPRGVPDGERRGGFGEPGGMGRGGAPPGEPPIEGGPVTAESAPETRSPQEDTARRNFQNSPEFKAFRGFVGCAYVTLLTEADARAKGIDAQGGRPALLYVPSTGLAFVQARQLPQGGGSLKTAP